MSAATTAPAPASPTRRRRATRRPDALRGAVAVLAVLVLWQLVSATGLVSTDDVPSATGVLSELASLAGDGGFWSEIGHTLEGWAAGMAIALAAGIALGLALGASDVAYHALRVPVEFLRPIPSVALVPLAVLVYGTGLQSVVFLVAYAALWPVLLNTIYGVRDVEPVALDTARVYGLGPAARLRHVILPSAVPSIATGVRVASSIALILAVTAQLVIGSPGIGRAITVSEAGGALERMYALIVAAGVLGLLLNAVLTRVERRALRWHPGRAGAAS
jgi:ABC-type nitrate/sulfonate/bicarbonate transport system permease component